MMGYLEDSLKNRISPEIVRDYLELNYPQYNIDTIYDEYLQSYSSLSLGGFTNTDLNYLYITSPYRISEIEEEIETRLSLDLYNRIEIFDLYKYYPAKVETLLIEKAIDNNIYLLDLANITYPPKRFVDSFLNKLLSNEELYMENYTYLFNENELSLVEDFQRIAIEHGSKYLRDSIMKITLESGNREAISSLPLDRNVFLYLLANSPNEHIDDYVFANVEYIEYALYNLRGPEDYLPYAIDLFSILDGYDWLSFRHMIKDYRLLSSFFDILLDDQV